MWQPDAQAPIALARITRVNFRLIDRLFTQVERVMKIKEMLDAIVEPAT